MARSPRGNALIFQSGGVTAVLNRTLAGAVQEALAQPAIGELYGAVRGLDGLLAGEVLDLRRQPQRAWAAIARTPGAALGSARRKLRAQDTDRALETLRRLRVAFLIPIGGNDSAETALRLASATRDASYPLALVAAPKTIDNDLPETDHCPGYGSAARFLALAAMGAGRDAESMGAASPITVLEVMGRNAGWLAAASALGKREERDPPHFIGLPEAPFREEAFMARMEEAYRAWGFALAVVSENLQDAHGPVGHRGNPLFRDEFGHPYHPSPAEHLAAQLSLRLKVRVRFEKPGTIQRSFVACVSPVDAREAWEVGRAAVRAAVASRSGLMVTLLREDGPRYRCSTGLAPLEAIAGKERTLPEDWYDRDTGLPNAHFLDYSRPLVGPLPRFARLR